MVVDVGVVRKEEQDEESRKGKQESTDDRDEEQDQSTSTTDRQDQVKLLYKVSFFCDICVNSCPSVHL